MPCTGGTKGATKRFASTATLGFALFLALSASPAAAATCDDYSNQRDAQLAAAAIGKGPENGAFSICESGTQLAVVTDGGRVLGVVTLTDVLRKLFPRTMA